MFFQTEIIIALTEQIEQVKLQVTKSDVADESSTNPDLFDESISETKPLIKKPMKKLFYTPNKKVSLLSLILEETQHYLLPLGFKSMKRCFDQVFILPITPTRANYASFS